MREASRSELESALELNGITMATRDRPTRRAAYRLPGAYTTKPRRNMVALPSFLAQTHALMPGLVGKPPLVTAAKRTTKSGRPSRRLGHEQSGPCYERGGCTTNDYGAARSCEKPQCDWHQRPSRLALRKRAPGFARSAQTIPIQLRSER